MTKADRLFAIVKAVNAVAAAFHEESQTNEPNGGGRWPNDRSPYIITAHPEGQRVAVHTADGDVIAGVGKTVDAAIAHLERKVNRSGAASPVAE